MATGKQVKIYGRDGALLATATFLNADGQVTLDFEVSAPPRIRTLLDRIRRRGILIPIIPEVDERPPPGFKFEPATADNLGRIDEEVLGLYPEGVGMTVEAEVIG